MKINIISESTFFPNKSGGMHTAFVNQVELFKKQQLAFSVNSMGKADITHIHSLGPFAFYKLMTSKHTVVSSHMLPETFMGSFIGGYLLQGVIKKYLLYCYNNAEMVFALTRNAKRKLLELGVNTRIELLPNPLDSKKFRVDRGLRLAGREEYKIKPDDFVILGVGNLIPRKGLEDFISVARKFPKYIFIWAGSKIFPLINAETEQQKRLLKNLPDNILLAGHVPYEKMPELYNACDVLLFPSKQEIASMVILEAAACGLPLILRDLPEYKELYGNEYLSGADSEDFVATVKKLSRDGEFYKKFKQGSLRLATKFNSDSIAKKMLKHYSSLLKKN